MPLISWSLYLVQISALITVLVTNVSSGNVPSCTSSGPQGRVSFHMVTANSKRRAESFLIISFDDAVGNKFLKMPDQHALRNSRNRTLEFAGTPGPILQTPQNRALPTTIHDAHHRVHRALANFLF